MLDIIAVIKQCRFLVHDRLLISHCIKLRLKQVQLNLSNITISHLDSLFNQVKQPCYAGQEESLHAKERVD